MRALYAKRRAAGLVRTVSAVTRGKIGAGVRAAAARKRAARQR